MLPVDRKYNQTTKKQMRDYSQAAQTWARAEPEEGPADEETGSLGTHSAHSGGKAGRDQDQTMNTTASDLTSVREGEVSVLSGGTSPYQHGGGHRQSRQDDYDGAAEEEHDDDDDVLDPAELEMLNEEAERMKGIGNRHMANQVRHRYICVCVCAASIAASVVLLSFVRVVFMSTYRSCENVLLISKNIV